MKWENILRQEIMVLLQHEGRRLEPRSFMRAIRCDNGARGLMGKSQKSKVKKAMAPWKMPPDFWTAIDKGLPHYTRNAIQNNKGAAAPFP
jgi:hypothetical protein